MVAKMATAPAGDNQPTNDELTPKSRDQGAREKRRDDDADHQRGSPNAASEVFRPRLSWKNSETT